MPRATPLMPEPGAFFSFGAVTLQSRRGQSMLGRVLEDFLF